MHSISSRASVSLETMTQATAEEAVGLTGEVIGGVLEVQDLLGKGGMGVVYQVYHREWNRNLAMKVPLNLGEGAQFDLRRWVREAHTWIDLGLHPRVVSCWFVREWRRVPVLFLDLCPGGSLKERLDRRPGPPESPEEWAEALTWLIHASEGLSYAHQRGLAHRDIKPANLLFTEDGSLAVTDFGLSKAFKGEEPSGDGGGVHADLVDDGRDTSLTRSGVMTGTPHFAPPEQWMQKKVGPESDIYSLGVVMYLVLTGRHPFEPPGEKWNLGKLITAHLMTPPSPPKQFVDRIPERLSSLIVNLLAKQPAERPESLAPIRESLLEAYRELVGSDYPHGVPQPLSQRADSLNNKAVSLWSIGLKTEAMQAWVEADRVERNHFEVAYNRTVTSWLLGRSSAADTESALRELSHQSWQGRASLGRFLLARGEYREASLELEKALGAPELNAEGAVWRSLGEAYFRSGDEGKARRALERTLERIPNDEAALDLLRRLDDGDRSQQEGEVARTSLGPFPAARLWTVSEDGRGVLLLFGRELVSVDRFGVEGRRLSIPGLRGAASLDRSGSTLLVCGSEGYLSFHLSEGQTAEIRDVREGQGRALGLLDEERILTGETTLQVRAREDGQALGGLMMGHEKQVLSFLLLTDGVTLVTGGADRTVRLWSLGDAQCRAEGRGHRDFVLRAATARQEQLLMTADRSGLLLFWLLPSLERVHSLQFSGEIVRLEVHLVSEGETLFVEYKSAEGGSRTAQVLLDRFQVALDKPGRFVRWSEGFGLLDEDRLRLIGLPEGIEWRSWLLGEAKVLDSLDCSDGVGSYIWTDSGELGCWRFPPRLPEPPSLALVRANTLSEAQQARQQYASLMEKTRAALAAGGHRDAYWFLSQARLVEGYAREPETLELLNRLAETLCRRELREMWPHRALPAPGRDLPRQLAFDGEGRWAATSSGPLVRLWDMRSGVCVRGLAGHREEVVALFFWDTGDGARRQPVLLSFSTDRTARVWDTETGEVLFAEAVTEQPLVSAAVCTRSLTFVAQDEGGRLHWGRWGAEAPYRVEVSGESVDVEFTGKLALASGGRWLAVTDKTTKIFHRSDPFARPRQRTELPYRLALFPSGHRHLLGVDAQNSLALYDLQDSIEVSTLEEQIDIPHASLISTRDGSVIAAVDLQNRLRFWLLELQRCVMERPLGESHYSFTFSGDGRYLGALTPDGRIVTWELEWQLDPDRPGAAALYERLPTLGVWGRLRKRFGL